MLDQRLIRAQLFLLKLRTEKELQRIRCWEFWKWTKKGELENTLLVIDILLEDDYIMLSAVPKELQEKLKTL